MFKKYSAVQIGILAASFSTIVFFQNCGQQAGFEDDNAVKKPSSSTLPSTSVSEETSSNPFIDSPEDIAPEVPTAEIPDADEIVDVQIGSPNNQPAVSDGPVSTCSVIYIDSNSLLKRHVKILPQNSETLDKCAHFYNQLPDSWTTTKLPVTTLTKQRLILSTENSEIEYKREHIPPTPRICSFKFKAAQSTTTQTMLSIARMEKTCTARAAALNVNGNTITELKFNSALVSKTLISFASARGSTTTNTCKTRYLQDGTFYDETMKGDNGFSKDKCMSYHHLLHGRTAGAALYSIIYNNVTLDQNSSAHYCTLNLNFKSTYVNIASTQQNSIFYFNDSCKAWEDQVKSQFTSTYVTSASSPIYAKLKIVNSDGLGTHDALPGEFSLSEYSNYSALAR